MGLLTKSKIRSISNNMPSYRSATILFEEAHKFNRYHYDNSIFLSHSHLDKDYVKDVVAFLRDRDVNCYVDWMDDTMPEKTSGITASIIKTKIKENNKFVFLATNNALSSKWCNWEIGYGDAQKYIDRIAIFPLKDDNGEWQGNEYLQIYPYIYEADSSHGLYFVRFPDGTVKCLYDWLKK